MRCFDIKFVRHCPAILGALRESAKKGIVKISESLLLKCFFALPILITNRPLIGVEAVQDIA
jgi:hypothetical protein